MNLKPNIINKYFFKNIINIAKKKAFVLSNIVIFIRLTDFI